MSNRTASVFGIDLTALPGGREAVAVEYFLLNVVVSSVIPIPLAGPLAAAGALLFGLVLGMTLNVLSSVLAAYLALLLTRGVCRPCILRMLGEKGRAKWEALDAAITADGPWLALLIRLSPLSPMVLTNFLLSLTSISPFHYVWTTALGVIPGNLPYAYAAEVGASLADTGHQVCALEERVGGRAGRESHPSRGPRPCSNGYADRPPNTPRAQDPLMLGMTVVGMVASLGIALKIASIARRALRRHGIDGAPSELRPAVGGNAEDWCPMDDGVESELSMAEAGKEEVPGGSGREPGLELFPVGFKAGQKGGQKAALLQHTGGNPGGRRSGATDVKPSKGARGFRALMEEEDSERRCGAGASDAPPTDGDQPSRAS